MIRLKAKVSSLVALVIASGTSLGWVLSFAPLEVVLVQGQEQAELSSGNGVMASRLEAFPRSGVMP